MSGPDYTSRSLSLQTSNGATNHKVEMTVRGHPEEATTVYILDHQGAFTNDTFVVRPQKELLVTTQRGQQFAFVNPYVPTQAVVYELGFPQYGNGSTDHTTIQSQERRIKPTQAKKGFKRPISSGPVHSDSQSCCGSSFSSCLCWEFGR